MHFRERHNRCSPDSEAFFAPKFRDPFENGKLAGSRRM